MLNVIRTLLYACLLLPSVLAFILIYIAFIADINGLLAFCLAFIGGLMIGVNCALIEDVHAGWTP